jgi:hypothetical protein
VITDPTMPPVELDRYLQREDLIMQPITLHPAQSVTITILADNFFDGLLLNLSSLRPAMPWQLLPLGSSFPLTAQASVLFIAWRHSFLTLFYRVVLAHASNCKCSLKQEAVLKAKAEKLLSPEDLASTCASSALSSWPIRGRTRIPAKIAHSARMF